MFMLFRDKIERKLILVHWFISYHDGINEAQLFGNTTSSLDFHLLGKFLSQSFALTMLKIFAKNKLKF